MGQSSQAGQVGFRTQSAKGSYADPGAAAPNSGVFMRTLSGALGGSRELLIPDPEIGGNRDIPDAYLGGIAFAGEYEFYGRMESLATLLRAALGSGSSNSAGSEPDLVGTHTVTPANTVPWLSIEEAIGSNYEVFRYTDAVVNTLHLEADANGYLRGTVGLIALSQTAGNTRTAGPYVDTTPMMVGSTIVVTYNSLPLPAKSFSIDINNNFEDDDFRLGSVFLGDLTPKRREITMGVTIRPQDSVLWRTAMYGSAAATQALPGAAVKQPVSVTAESYETIGASSDKFSLDVDIPLATIRPFEVSPSGDDVIEHDLEIQALRPNPVNPILTAQVKNGLAAIA